MFHHNNREKIDEKSRKIMIFAKKKILVLCDDPPEDRLISIFTGCLANHDRTHIQHIIPTCLVLKVLRVLWWVLWITTPVVY
jgi:hypothetical protein